MKKFLILALVLSMVCCSAAFASLPVGLELTPTPEDYAYTDLSEHKTVRMTMVGDGESTYPDYPEILALVNEELAKFNTTLEVTILSWADIGTMYPLILAGGDECDLLFVATWLHLWTGAQQESFYPIDEEFIRKYMPYTDQYQDDASWAQVTYNGVIQGVCLNDSPAHPTLIAIRTDLAEQYGLSTDITSWEELKEYLLGIAAHTEESGVFAFNAKKGESIAASTLARQHNLYTVGNAGNFRFVFGDGSVPAPEDLTFYYTADYYRWALDESYELAQAGCWSRSAMSRTETASQAFQNGTGAVMSWNYTVYQYATYLERNILGVEPGDATKIFMLNADKYLVDSAPFNNDLYAIMASSKDPCRAAMVLDILKFNTELNATVMLGVEGRHWVDIGDGYFMNGPEYEAYTPNGMCWAWALGNANWKTRSEREDQNAMQAFCDAHVGVNPTMSFVFNPEAVAGQEAAISAAIDEHSGALVVGLVEDVDVAYQAFLDHLEESGLQAYIDEYISQYTAWYNAL